MPKFQECHCFFSSLGFYVELDFYSISPETLRAAYKKASLARHPDKNDLELKHLSTRTQQVINQVRAIIGDQDRRFAYLDDGSPPEEFDHDCEDLKPVLEFIRDRLEPKKSTSPESTSTTENDLPRSNNFDISNNDDDEASSLFGSPNRSSSSSTKNKRGRRKSIFEPKGYQLKGGKVTFNKQRTQGTVYKMEWAEKPGYSTWLSEEDLVKHYPNEAREYLEQLKRDKSRRLSPRQAPKGGTDY